ncbi:hypothetical protein JTE90_027184 [Oedothorax gibbosus]|uniref:Uncharacterized protein n=1 Tax=Oedothorax gibbosus TaxID=931172 RepID=A0AAV6TM00_9ARAC|nr:hypothetical protein JTE90_027184 [Oedothorax gibbosus]
MMHKDKHVVQFQKHFSNAPRRAHSEEADKRRGGQNSSAGVNKTTKGRKIRLRNKGQNKISLTITFLTGHFSIDIGIISHNFELGSSAKDFALLVSARSYLKDLYHEERLHC